MRPYVAQCRACIHWRRTSITRGICWHPSTFGGKPTKEHSVCEHYERKVIRVVELKPDQRAG